MTKPRIPETDKGIQGQDNVSAYDQMQRNQKERGWGIAPQLIKNGITSGLALEIGHGPGYLGTGMAKSYPEHPPDRHRYQPRDDPPSRAKCSGVWIIRTHNLPDWFRQPFAIWRQFIRCSFHQWIIA